MKACQVHNKTRLKEANFKNLGLNSLHIDGRNPTDSLSEKQGVSRFLSVQATGMERDLLWLALFCFLAITVITRHTQLISC